MNGIAWMDKLLKCEQARRNLPLELQATLPLPGRRGGRTAECWYYRLDGCCGEPKLSSPARYVLWDVETMQMLDMKRLQPTPLGSGADLLTKAQREREDAYLEDMLTPFLNGSDVDSNQMIDAWLAVAPQAMRQWLQEALREER